MDNRDLEESKNDRQIMHTSRTNERRQSHNMALAKESDYINDSSSFHPTVHIENTIHNGDKNEKQMSILSDEDSDDQDLQVKYTPSKSP